MIKPNFRLLHLFNLLLCVCLFSSFSLSAKEVTIGKLKYKVNTTDKIAKCTGLANEATKNYNLVIPSTVEYNGVTLKVTTVEKDAFWFDNYLKKVTLSDYTETIGSRAFADCDNLSIVSLGKNLKTIGTEAFAHSGNAGTLTSLSLPSTVLNIHDHAFMDCRCLNTVSMGDKVETIGDNAFWNCVALKSITFPGSLKTVGKSAFANCESLNDVTFKHGTANTVIGEKCFDNVKSLKVLNFLGSGVVEIGPSAFIGCSIQWLGLPSSLQTIGSGAFCGNNLTMLDLPEGLKTIGDFAFTDQSGFGVQTLIIPSTVTSIGKKAFNGVGNLQSLTSKAINPPVLAENVFDNYATTYCDLWVPQASLQKYMPAYGWKEFKYINNTPTTVEDIESDFTINDEEWFDLSGKRISKDSLLPGIYIIRHNGKTEKRRIQ